MIAEQPVRLPGAEAQIVGSDLEQFVVEHQTTDVELGMAPRPCGDHQLRRMPVDETAELRFGERRCDHMEVVDQQRDTFTGPRFDTGGQGCR